MAMESFRKGAEVEVSSNEEDRRGAWYAATIVKPPSTKTKKVLVEYKTLMADEAGTKPLQEAVDLVQVRPIPPREINRSFKFSEEVDAYHNDGWWEGVVTEVLPKSRCSVFFRGTREQIHFKPKDLRLHRQWVDGNWAPPLEDQVVSLNSEVKTSNVLVKEKCSNGKRKRMSPITGMTTSKMITAKVKFSKGTPVEVSSDEEGFQGAWFAATVVKAIQKNKFLIEYQSLRNDDDTEFLREEVDSLHIRPTPPETVQVEGCFNLFDEVDVFYNEGWWVGMISKVLAGSWYAVFFVASNEEMEFPHCDLRLHQEWIGNRWVVTSRPSEDFCQALECDR